MGIFVQYFTYSCHNNISRELLIDSLKHDFLAEQIKYGFDVKIVGCVIEDEIETFKIITVEYKIYYGFNTIKIYPNWEKEGF